MRYSFDNFNKFIKENQGIKEICRTRTDSNLDCEGCKFEAACKEFFEKEFSNGSLHDR
jgi:hypothetical protein